MSSASILILIVDRTGLMPVLWGKLQNPVPHHGPTVVVVSVEFGYVLCVPITSYVRTRIRVSDGAAQHTDR